MVDLIEAWRDSYDYVLLDTPPIVGIADAQALASKADGIVLVSSLAKCTRSTLVRSMEIFDVSQLNPVGLVVNQVSKQHGGDYYNEYSAYYTEATLKAKGNGHLSHKTPIQEKVTSFFRRL